jgi:hypothetical protein
LTADLEWISYNRNGASVYTLALFLWIGKIMVEEYDRMYLYP